MKEKFEWNLPRGFPCIHITIAKSTIFLNNILTQSNYWVEAKIIQRKTRNSSRDSNQLGFYFQWNYKHIHGGRYIKQPFQIAVFGFFFVILKSFIIATLGAGNFTGLKCRWWKAKRVRNKQRPYGNAFPDIHRLSICSKNERPPEYFKRPPLTLARSSVAVMRGWRMTEYFP